MDQIAFIHNFITSLVFTVTVETIVLVILLKYIFKKHNLVYRNIIFAGLFASFATIPYVTFVFPKLLSWPRSTSLLVAEIFATIIEAIFYIMFLKIDWKYAFVVSIVCNAISYYLGHLLHSHGFWFVW